MIEETTLVEDVFYIFTVITVVAIVTVLFAYTIYSWNKDKDK